MFPGSPAPLPAWTPLKAIVELAGPEPPVGVWARGCSRMQRWGVRGGGLLVGADLGVMERDAKRMRGDGPFVFAEVTHDIGVREIADHMLTAFSARRTR